MVALVKLTPTVKPFMKKLAIAMVSGAVFLLTTAAGVLAGLIGDIARAQLPDEARDAIPYQRARGGSGPTHSGGSRGSARRAATTVHGRQRAV